MDGRPTLAPKTRHDGQMRGVHHTVQQVAEAHGYDLHDPRSIRRLQAHNWRDIPAEDVELLEQRLLAGSDAAFGRTRGRLRPFAAALLVDQAVLRVVAPIAHEIPTWRTWRDEGHEPDDVIAARAGTAESVVWLALDGLPGRPLEVIVEQQLAEAARRWSAGHDEEHVADALERSSEWLRRAMRTGRLHLNPYRLQIPAIADRLGISGTLATKWAQREVLPSPDGRRQTGAWWWSTTIETWARETLTYPCQGCTARFPSALALRVHTSKMHPSA